MGMDTAQKLSLGSLLCFTLGAICLITFLRMKDREWHRQQYPSAILPSGVRSRTHNMIAAEN
jgi:hypothetical protein